MMKLEISLDGEETDKLMIQLLKQCYRDQEWYLEQGNKKDQRFAKKNRKAILRLLKYHMVEEDYWEWFISETTACRDLREYLSTENHAKCRN